MLGGVSSETTQKNYNDELRSQVEAKTAEVIDIETTQKNYNEICILKGWSP